MRRILAWGALGLLVAAGAGADWLVLKDGTRVETKGDWQQKGRQVQFKTPDGRFQALPAGEVDLEASRKANAAPPEESRKERLLKGEAVELPSVDPTPSPAPEPDFGDSLAEFIRDPDAPRIQTLPSLELDESQLEIAYRRRSDLANYRRRAVCAIGEDKVRQIEAAFERGELAGLDPCYDKEHHPDSDSVDWCLGDVLGRALRDAAGGASDPCRRPPDERSDPDD